MSLPKSFIESIVEYKQSISKFDDAVDEYIFAYLIKAVEYGHIDIVQEIVNYMSIDINAVYIQIWNPSITLLCKAIMSPKINGQPKINMVKYLLTLGANPNLKYIDDDGDEYFALYTTGILYIQGTMIKEKTWNPENMKDAIEIIQILVQSGADINQQSKEYSNIMCVGVMFNSLDLIKLCISDYGAIITNMCLLIALSSEKINDDIIRYLVYEKKLIHTVDELKTNIRLESRLHQSEDEFISMDKMIELWIK
jgi:hypothetical protein